jgi:hypothetical protein
VVKLFIAQIWGNGNTFFRADTATFHPPFTYLSRVLIIFGPRLADQFLVLIPPNNEFVLLFQGGLALELRPEALFKTQFLTIKHFIEKRPA